MKHPQPQKPMLQSAPTPVEGRLHRCVPSLPAIRLVRLRAAKVLVEKAVKSRKVFSIQGPYPVIRAALWARGWVERRLPRPPMRSTQCQGEEEELDDGDDGADVCDGLYREKDEIPDDMYDLMSRLVRNETTSLYWTTRRDDIDLRSLQNDQMTNHYANAGSFTTKVGLCVNLRNLQWFDTADPDTFFPRCYRLGSDDERLAFIDDFRRTACTSLLQHVVKTSRWRREPSAKHESDNLFHHPVDIQIIDTALQVCQEFMNGLKHADLDVTTETPPSMSEQQWAAFLHDYSLVVHKGALIRSSRVIVQRCEAMLARLQEVCPQLHTDGLNNIWIIKPGAMSRGRGIMCMNRLEEILALVGTDRAVVKESKWVVQKYLECPLLVHGTKFDLRQWFLVTDWNPLTVWFYKECYLRFSTQPYSTKTLDSSVHLCNNSIQKYFQPSPDRHPEVPKDNMWSCSHFRSFLRQEGREAEWESVVVPGMQQAVIHALQTSQDLVEPRRASFELYGADFMLDKDLRPWLLEINASPTMARSTAVTARLCPAVQVDTLKVVLDHRTDPTAHTGGFQLIFKQAAVLVPHYVGVNLLVEGAPIKQHKTLLHRQTVIFNLPVSFQLPSECLSPQKGETKQKPSCQKPDKVSGFHLSGKENQQKKSQTTPMSPKRESEIRTDVQNVPRVRKPCRSLTCELVPVAQTEPKRKARRLGSSLHVNGSVVVPRSLSFSLSPPHSQPEGKPQISNAARRSQASTSFLPPLTFDLPHRTRARPFPPVQGHLSGLEICGLQQNIMSGAGLCRSFHSSLSKHQSLLHEKQNPNRNKRLSTGNDKQEDAVGCKADQSTLPVF